MTIRKTKKANCFSKRKGHRNESGKVERGRNKMRRWETKEAKPRAETRKVEKRSGISQ